MATIEIHSWSTTCSECRKGADWEEEGHLTIRGFGDDNGSPGCGAKWDGISFSDAVYQDGKMLDPRESFWGPAWMRRLPLIDFNYWR